MAQFGRPSGRGRARCREPPDKPGLKFKTEFVEGPVIWCVDPAVVQGRGNMYMKCALSVSRRLCVSVRLPRSELVGDHAGRG